MNECWLEYSIWMGIVHVHSNKCIINLLCFSVLNFFCVYGTNVFINLSYGSLTLITKLLFCQWFVQFNIDWTFDTFLILCMVYRFTYSAVQIKLSCFSLVNEKWWWILSMFCYRKRNSSVGHFYLHNFLLDIQNLGTTWKNMLCISTYK